MGYLLGNCWRGGANPSSPAAEPFQVIANGAWTWFTDPRAVYRNGATYIGSMTSSGSVVISKYDHASGTTTSFTLKSALEIDDHDVPSVSFTPDGRVVAHYCAHNDNAGTRVRVSTNAEDISTWGAEILITAVGVPITYSNPHYLSATGLEYLHYRSGPGGTGTNPMNVIATGDYATWDAERTWITKTGTRPYVKSINNGVDRIDFVFTNCHPDQGPASIYHCYMQLDGSTENIYKSDGTLIGTGDVTPEASTRIYDGSSVDGWTWDIAYGADGHPRVLFARFPTTSDHRYMFSRWTGTAWTTPVEITAGGANLYSAQLYYSGGLCFDSADPNRVYLSTQTSGQWEIQEWRTSDDGATWAKHRDITSGSSVKNCRPYSPRNRADDLAVLWWRGTYTAYTNYSTAIWGIGAAA